jgi:hypothetical protein
MSSPVAARVAADALGMRPTSYGHLIQMAARYGWQRLDGRTVVNRQTGAPITLVWSRGLENVAAPGTPPLLLLAVPAIPAMVAAARYIGAFAGRSPPPDVQRYRAFAAAVEVCDQRLDVALIVRENRRGLLFLDRLLGHVAAPRRQEGGANSDDTGPIAPTGPPAGSADPPAPPSGSPAPNVVLAQFAPPMAPPVAGVPPPGAPGSAAPPDPKLGRAFLSLIDPRPLFDALGNLVHPEPPRPEQKPPATAPDPGPPASAPAGSGRVPAGIQPGTNPPSDIDGTDFVHSEGDAARPPAGSRPIDQTPWSGDHDEIKDAIGAGNKDNVRISPIGEVWAQNPDGSWTNHGSASSFTGSGRPSGRRGKDRQR